MIINEEMKERGWTPYREITRYRRLLVASILLNVLLAAALIRCLIHL